MWVCSGKCPLHWKCVLWVLYGVTVYLLSSRPVAEKKVWNWQRSCIPAFSSFTHEPDSGWEQITGLWPTTTPFISPSFLANPYPFHTELSECRLKELAHRRLWCQTVGFFKQVERICSGLLENFSLHLWSCFSCAALIKNPICLSLMVKKC